FLGDVMIRTDALRRTGGFDEAMIAGEEAELGQRIRQLGLRLLQLADPMTLHDMGMTRFRQWWRRATRTGHAYAESAWPRDATRHRHHVRDCVRAIGWGQAWPAMLAASIVLAAVGGGGRCRRPSSRCRRSTSSEPHGDVVAGSAPGGGTHSSTRRSACCRSRLTCKAWRPTHGRGREDVEPD
ncbi:MAG: hypothetical protein ACO4CI_07220, partial [Phycisphaerales bacterium]